VGDLPDIELEIGGYWVRQVDDASIHDVINRCGVRFILQYRFADLAAIEGLFYFFISGFIDDDLSGAGC